MHNPGIGTSGDLKTSDSNQDSGHWSYGAKGQNLLQRGVGKKASCYACDAGVHLLELTGFSVFNG